MQVIDMPTAIITSCCFGGDNYDSLYVTCGKSGVSGEDFSTTQPLAGSVFKVTGLGVKGAPAPVFEG